MPSSVRSNGVLSVAQRDGATRNGDVERREVPRWDASSHTLYWRGRPIKHFSKDARNQAALLQWMQDHGWEEFTPVALPLNAIETKAQLHKTKENLNNSLRGFLHFHLEGSGSRLRWEVEGR